MKKLFFLSLVLISGIVNPGFASGDKKNKSEAFSVGMYQVKESDLLKIFVEKTGTSALTLALQDDHGRVLLTETLGKKMKKGAYLFDLSSLKDGIYQLVFKNATGTEVRQVSVRSKVPLPENKKLLSFN